MLLFAIQSRMRANNQRVYTPKEGALVSDINRVRWGGFRKASLCLQQSDELELSHTHPYGGLTCTGAVGFWVFWAS